MKTVAMIPCRLGSERIPFKNLRYMGDKLLCEWAVETAFRSGLFYDIFINSESDVFKQFARGNKNTCFHKRPDELATSTAKTDDFVYQFITRQCRNTLADSDIVILVNPTSPLLAGMELVEAWNAFTRGNYNSMNTVVKHRIHTMWMDEDGKPKGINCSFKGKLQKTQDLKPTYTMAFAFMGWRVRPFKEAYERDGYALFNPPCYFAEVSGKTAVNKLSCEEDWEVVERILTGSYGPPRYHEAITKLIN